MLALARFGLQWGRDDLLAAGVIDADGTLIAGSTEDQIAHYLMRREDDYGRADSPA